LPDFTKKFQNFVTTGWELAGAWRGNRAPISTGAITPGDILYFLYGADNVVVLVVGKKTSKAGLFVSPKGNKLLSCFKLVGKSATTINLIVNALYKNRVLSSYMILTSYAIQTGLRALLGRGSYRTYNTAMIQHLRKLSKKEEEEKK
jgi:hypothetical protein